MALVDEGFVRRGVYDDAPVNARTSNFYENDGYSSVMPVRPIINLPSNIKVEEVSGEWTIID